MMKLSHSDIELASELLTKEGPSAMYDKLAEKVINMRCSQMVWLGGTALQVWRR